MRPIAWVYPRVAHVFGQAPGYRLLGPFAEAAGSCQPDRLAARTNYLARNCGQAPLVLPSGDPSIAAHCSDSRNLEAVVRKAASGPAWIYEFSRHTRTNPACSLAVE